MRFLSSKNFSPLEKSEYKHITNKIPFLGVRGGGREVFRANQVGRYAGGVRFQVYQPHTTKGI